MQVSHWPIEKVTPYDKNPRRHSASQVAKIVKSIQEFGWTIPLLVTSKGELIAGHGRLLAAGKLGMETVPVLIASDLTAAQISAYRIADNQIAELSDWNEDLLSQEFEALKAFDFDTMLTGFDLNAIDKLLGGKVPDPPAPEPPADPVTKVGDVWLLGDHRLLCGDATKAEDVAKVLEGDTPNLMVTDPPYGVEYDAGLESREQLQGIPVTSVQQEKTVSNDDIVDEVIRLERRLWLITGSCFVCLARGWSTLRRAVSYCVKSLRWLWTYTQNSDYLDEKLTL